MAIAANQLKVSKMVEAKQEDFNKASDAAAKQTAAAKGVKSSLEEAANAAAPKDALSKKLSKPDIKTPDLKKQKGGMFSNALCCKLPSLKIRLPKLKFSLSLRKLKFSFKNNLSFSLSICGKEKKINPTNAILNTANFIKKNPGILSPDKSTRLNALLKSDLLGKMNLLGLGATLPTCILGKSVGSLYGTSASGLGPSVRSRNGLKELLYQDPCTAMFAKQPLINKWLSDSIAGQFIGTLVSADKEKAFSYVDLALGVMGQRESALGSLASALAYAYDYNTRKKFELVNQVIGTGKLRGPDYIYLKTDSKKLLENLDAEKEKNDNKTKDPIKDFDTIVGVLGTVDPSWNKDPVSTKNEPNYSATACNKTLYELSNKVLTSTNVELSLTGTYTTALKPEHHIAIIHKFNCSCIC